MGGLIFNSKASGWLKLLVAAVCGPWGKYKIALIYTNSVNIKSLSKFLLTHGIIKIKLGEKYIFSNLLKIVKPLTSIKNFVLLEKKRVNTRYSLRIFKL